MALKGFSGPLADRGIQQDLKVVGVAKPGTLYMLGSQSDYVQLASQAVMFVLDWEVTADGVSATDVVMGITVEKTKANEPARLRALAPGDLIQVDTLASAGDVGALQVTSKPNEALGVDHATGKLRIKQAFDVEIARIAPDGGNLFSVDGSIWAEIVRLV